MALRAFAASNGQLFHTSGQRNIQPPFLAKWYSILSTKSQVTDLANGHNLRRNRAEDENNLCRPYSQKLFASNFEDKNVISGLKPLLSLPSVQRNGTGETAFHVLQHSWSQCLASRTIFTSVTSICSNKKCQRYDKRNGIMLHSTVSTAAITKHIGNAKKSSGSGKHDDETGEIRIEKCPKMELARSMPLTMREASNEIVFTMASQGNNDACCEMLRRHIMVKDNVTYEAANKKLKEIRLANVGGQKIGAYIHVGVIGATVMAGFMSFLLVFDINTVLYFNEHYVTMDVPNPEELDTTLEVGAWSWNWMEPPLGQISFFLLCMQFAKGECEFLGIDPLHDWYRNRRAERLVKKYPMYNSKVLRDFSLSERYFRR